MSDLGADARRLDPFDARNPVNLPDWNREMAGLFDRWNYDQSWDLPDFEDLYARYGAYPDDVGYDQATERFRLPVPYQQWRDVTALEREIWVRYRTEMLAADVADVVGLDEWRAQQLERPDHQRVPPTPSPSRPEPLDHVDGASAPSDAGSVPATRATPPSVARSARVDRGELLARIDLEALLDSVSGRADGRRRWHCPEREHTDEHPSVSVHISADGVPRWRCWSGGHGGTAIDVVVGARGVDAGEAMRWLAEHHTSLPVAERRPTPSPVAQLGHPDPAVARYATQASKLLWTAAGRPQRDWLAARGLGPEVLRANAVGADPGRRLLARPKGLPGGWPAVVYPSMTPHGEIVYLQARYLDPPATRSKYDNPSARLAANPRLAWTRPVGPPSDDVLVVCEGTADALIVAQGGLASVGVLGAGYPDARVADGLVTGLRHHPSLRGAEVAICFDSDPAGTAGSARLVELLAERNVAACECRPPDGLDLTTWAAVEPRWIDALPTRAATLAAPTIDSAARLSLPPPAAERSISIGGVG